MKHAIGLILAAVMILSLNVVAYATDSEDCWGIDEEEILLAIDELDEDFQNEEGCSTELIRIEADENYYQADEQMNGRTRGTTVPKTFHNIGTAGIYKGAFSSLRGTMYTSKYFDMIDGEYWSRVRCYGEYASLTYKIGNYCITCKKVLSTTEDDYYTPVKPEQEGNWVSLVHTVSSKHADHFVCPFVKNTSGLINDEWYAIGGDIWVNYYDSWD